MLQGNRLKKEANFMTRDKHQY